MFMRSFSCQRLLTVFFLGLFLTTVVAAPTHAAMVGTGQLLAAETPVADTTQIRVALRDALVARGVTGEEAALRVAALDDEEVLQLAGALDEDPAGSGIVTVAAVIFLVLLWTDIMGYTDVFPFVNRSPNGSQGPIVTEN